MTATGQGDPGSASLVEEAGLRLLVESVRDVAIFTLDPEGRVATWNGGAERTTGWRADEVIGRHLSIFHLAKDVARGEPEAALRLAAAQGSARDDGWRLRKDGSRFWASVEIAALRDGDGRLRGFGGVTCDLSRRTHSDALYRQLVEEAPDALVVTGQRGRIQFVNSQAERLFGWRRGELVGESIETLVPERFRASHVGQRAGYVKAPRVRPLHSALDLHALRKDGSEFPADIALSPVQGVDGPEVISTIRDVTVRRAMERALKKAKDELEAANCELEAFSESVANDLRAPLRQIEGFVSALLAGHADPLDETGRAHLGRVRAGAERMAQLIDDLLQLSGVSRGPLARDPVDLSALACSVVSGLAVSGDDRAVEVVIADGLSAHGDSGLLRLVLENLLGNAWKFTARTPAARIELGVGERGGERAFFVRDNGAGFDMRYGEKLFRAFQRLHSASEFPGTGIGLATVRRIISRHGGRVWAEGSIGAGATFYFTLPDAAPAAG